MYTGKQYRRGDYLTEDMVQEFVRASEKTTAIYPNETLGVDVTQNGINFSLPPSAEYVERANFHSRHAFLGQIVDRGPNGEADFANARYWVREVFEGTTCEQPNTERQKFINPVTLETTYPHRHVMAVNLAEYHYDAASDTHGFAPSTFDDPRDAPIVQVNCVLGCGSKPRFYFSHGMGQGSTLAFALVKGIPDPDAPIVQVQIIVPNADTGAWEGVRDDRNQPVIDMVWCWPPLTADHYEALVWPGVDVTPDCNPVGIRQVGSRFFAEQTLLTFPIRSPAVAHSDCAVY